jgi:phage baseplate assembly protein gpV
MATLFAGKDRGSWFIPENGDEVLVVFEGGDVRRPFVVGALWNGQRSAADQRRPAQRQKDHQEPQRHRDHPRRPGRAGETEARNARRLFDHPPGRPRRRSTSQDSNGNSIKLEAAGVTVTASARVTINASQVEVSAGMVSVSAGMSRFSGVVQADTVITNTIIAATYTPWRREHPVSTPTRPALGRRRSFRRRWRTIRRHPAGAGAAALRRRRLHGAHARDCSPNGRRICPELAARRRKLAASVGEATPLAAIAGSRPTSLCRARRGRSPGATCAARLPAA